MDLETRTLPHLTVYVDEASMFMDDLVADGQPQSAAVRAR